MTTDVNIAQHSFRNVHLWYKKIGRCAQKKNKTLLKMTLKAKEYTAFSYAGVPPALLWPQTSLSLTRSTDNGESAPRRTPRRMLIFLIFLGMFLLEKIMLETKILARGLTHTLYHAHYRARMLLNFNISSI